MANFILGISCWFHDSAAALVKDGIVVAAVQEERFSGIKYDSSFPDRSIQFCLQACQQIAGPASATISAVVFYDKPLLKFDRVLETALAVAPAGGSRFVRSMPIWMKQKLRSRTTLYKALKKHFDRVPELLFASHHQSHAASAFYPSPYSEAAVLCLDAVGEWAVASGWHGQDVELGQLWEQQFPHSVGLFYSAMTAWCGFAVNSGEYKLMGLAPLGSSRFQDRLRDEVIELREDGSIWLNLEYFSFLHSDRMYSDKLSALFGAPPRHPASDEPSQLYADVAASVQAITEEAILGYALRLHRDTHCTSLCLAGGVAHNCSAVGMLRTRSPFTDIWVQPAAGDAGGALGAALAWSYVSGAQRNKAEFSPMLGPQPDLAGVRVELAETLSDQALVKRAADWLSEGKILGWMQGPMEFGPRALGHRSILADPRPVEIREHINKSIKMRERFRPFAPVVQATESENWFASALPHPWMTETVPVQDLLPVPLSAVTHANGSARLQTVSVQQDPLLHSLLQAFAARTGVPVLLNTSLNGPGQPILQKVSDAIQFMHTNGLDGLIVNSLCITPQRASALVDERTARLDTTGIVKFTVQLAIPLSVASLWGLYMGLWTAPILLVTAALVIAAGVYFPADVVPLRADFRRLGKGVGVIVNHAILLPLFLLLILPVAVFLKAVGRDRLRRKRPPASQSLLVPSEEQSSASVQRFKEVW